MNERFPIQGDVLNCGACDFLGREGGGTICSKRLLIREINQIEICDTGPMVKIGTRQESHITLGKLSDTWRTQLRG